MTLDEFSTQITQKMGKTDTRSVSLCKGFLRRRYRMIYDGSLWKDTLTTVELAASTNILTMPEAVGLIVGIRWNQVMIDPVELSYLLRTDPTAFEKVGTPARFAPLTPIGMSALPSTAEALRFVSSSSSDTGIVCLIRGELSGVEQYEEVTLNGTSNVDSTKSWDKVYTLSKAATTGTVTISGVTSSTTYLTLWPYETEKKYLRIQLFSSPTDTTKNLLILAKRRFRNLEKDGDTPLIQGIENALLAFVEGDMLERERQYAKAQSKVQEGNAMLLVAKNMGVHQSANIVQLTPDTVGEWTRNDWE